MRNIYFCAICLVFLSACTVLSTENQFSRITRVNDIPCDEKADRLYLFFEGEPIDYSYERIGLVEASGQRYTSDDMVIAYLKQEAWNACANAIINIKRDFKTKVDSSILDDEDESDTYEVSVFSGLAVRIDTDMEFLEKYGNGLDLTFREEVAEDIQQQSKMSNAQIALSIGLAVLGLVVLVGMLGAH